MSVIIDGSAGVTTNTGAVYNSIQSATAQATTSGTSIDFTSIPSWVKRVTVLFNNVSLSSAASILVQIGNSTPTTSGYSSISSYTTNNVGYGALASIGGFVIQAGDPTYKIFGSLVINNLSGNIWVASGVLGNVQSTGYGIASSGIVTLGSTLNMLRITTTNGTDTFDFGSVNILYE